MLENHKRLEDIYLNDPHTFIDSFHICELDTVFILHLMELNGWTVEFFKDALWDRNVFSLVKKRSSRIDITWKQYYASIDSKKMQENATQKDLLSYQLIFQIGL